MPIAHSHHEAREQVEQLVERFARNLEAYKRPDYKETEVRVEFVNPFFEALGWDVRNVQGYAEQYKDVVHEDALKTGRATRAPDYCFRIGGTRKFFLEAKKPSVTVSADVGPAYQLRRYAWSAKLPLSILTDFEELAVYDCRQRPLPADKASTGRILYLTYDHYPARFDEIYGVFARESVLKGSFDRWIEATAGKRGTGEVDHAFLQEIEGWREALARCIALRNPGLSVHELNFAVQHTIDRILFLRMAEDRGLEEYGKLLALAAGPRIYPRLVDDLYRRADEKYNSGLFDFQADGLTPRLEIDDKVLKPILAGLYYPDSPYEFSVLPVEVLGQVYEQFLGKVIRLTAGHRAVVEEKPEVKKAGGVYYTPAYIVEYIVRQTVGKLVAGKSPHELRAFVAEAEGTDGHQGAGGHQGPPLQAPYDTPHAPRTTPHAPRTTHHAPRPTPLRILDMACGSGSFLLGAYQYLLDHYRRWYEENDPVKHGQGKQPAVYQGAGGGWRLTTAEKKRILLDHIYGVDVDRQAVEVTKLSLLLKVLEGETEETVTRQLAFWHERALPDLGKNIQCGNSLIGPDYFEGQLLPDEEEVRRVNPFDWQREFPEAMATGGFDVIIGNPPYVLLQDEFRNDRQGAYFRRRFQAAAYKLDTYPLFIERTIQLTKDGGLDSLITPANFMTNNYLQRLREVILDNCAILSLNTIEGGVFTGVSVDNVISVLRKGTAVQKWETEFVTSMASATELKAVRKQMVPQARFRDGRYMLFVPGVGGSIWIKARAESIPLGEICDVNFGMQLRDRKTFDRDVIQIALDETLPDGYARCFTGKNVGRYSLKWTGLACLENRQAQRGGCWDLDKHHTVGKILTKQIGKWPDFALDERGYNILNTVFMVVNRSATYATCYVLGILNSAFIRTLWFANYYDQRVTFPKIKGAYLQELPIRTIDFSKPADVARHDRMVALVERMLELHKKLAAASIPAEKELYQRQIEATDRQIDALVYELYGLSEEEIRLVEGQATA